MCENQALAAGQSGTDITPHRATAAPAPPAKPGKPVAKPAPPDDAYRQIAVEELAVQLSRGTALLAQCQVIAKLTPESLGPIREAARLMNANAEIAKALARMAQVERRSRTIVEADQKPDPENAGLNARFPAALESEILRVFALSLRQLTPSSP